MQKHWWIWLFGPALLTTALFVAVAAFADDDGEGISSGAIVMTSTRDETTATARTGAPQTTSAATTTSTAAVTTRPRTSTTTTTTTTSSSSSSSTATAPAATTRVPETTTTRASTTTTTTTTTRSATTTRARTTTPTPATSTTRKRRAKLARVPNVIGLSADPAVSELEEAGFRATIRRRRSLTRDGIVFEQIPAPGQRIRRGRTVRLTVAFYTPPEQPPPPPAPPVSAVPRLVGLDYAEAASRMEELGIFANSYPVRSSRPVAIVVDQTPARGTRVRRGSRIRLTVSVGKVALSPNSVPDTIGLSELDAHVRCRDAHFTCRTVLASGQAGSVVRQQPASGKTARALTQMTLYLGS